MPHVNLFAVIASVACLGVFCAPALAADAAIHTAPARVEATPDPMIKKVTLTPKAAERLGILIDEVRTDPAGRRIVPYASIYYDLTGKPWVYVASDPLSFVRRAVKIDSIKGENVYLSDGLDTGTKVLVAGIAQVRGAEVGVGH